MPGSYAKLFNFSNEPWLLNSKLNSLEGGLSYKKIAKGLTFHFSWSFMWD